MARGGGGKKKGAKGKKARQKAKLDRHWGQHVDDDEIKAAKYRKGKSRSGKHRSNGDGSTKGSEKKRPYAKDEAPPRSFDDMVAPSDSSDSLTGSDSDSDMDLSSSNNDAGGALSSLLSNIGGKGGSQKSKKKSRNVRTEDISDDEEEFSGDEDDEYMMDQDAHYGVEDDEEEAEDSDIDEESSDEDEEDNIDSDDESQAHLVERMDTPTTLEKLPSQSQRRLSPRQLLRCKSYERSLVVRRISIPVWTLCCRDLFWIG